MEICLFVLYCARKSIISNLSVSTFMFHVSCVILIESPAALFEHDAGTVFEVHIDSWF